MVLDGSMADEFDVDGAIAEAISLLNYYGFELDDNNATEVVHFWQTIYPTAWLRMAVLEALYRGRYKQISVEEILRSWQKWDRVRCNFDLEFESLICSKVEEQTPFSLSDPPQGNLEKSIELRELTGEVAANEVVSAVPETYEKLKAIAIEQGQILTEEQED